MTEIKELSSDTLKMIYKRDWFNRIMYLIPTVMFFGLAFYVLIWGRHEVPTGEYSAFAPVFLVVMTVGSLAAGLVFVSSVFDVTNYYFDKKGDKFQLKGRRYLYRRWMVEGSISEIISVSCEIYGADENTHSEIFLKYRYYGNVTETLKCGTGEPREDDNIADTIETFLGLGNKK